MLVELVQTRARDGVRLDGVFQAAAATSIGVDGFVIVHGTGGNFYSSSLLERIAVHLQQHAAGVVRVNTRGHDGISTATTAKGGRRQGAAYELVDDCRHDVLAWAEWLRQRVGSRIGLLGHSLGAVKCIYAAAHEATLAPECLIAVSPPRLSYSWFCESGSDDFLASYNRAEQKIAAGEPAALLEVGFPLPMIISAAGYREKYGPEEHYNFLTHLRHVRCPALITFGEIELANNVAFMQAPEAIAALARTNVKVGTIGEADHFYTGVHDSLVEHIQNWLSGR